MNLPRKVCVIDGSRIPFSRSGGKYLGVSNQEMMSAAMKGLVQKLNLQGKELGEVSLGAVVKHSADFNLARESVLDAGLAFETPAYDLQRACGTSLEAAINIANKIAMGQIDCGIAGGCDTNSEVPIEFSKSFSDRLMKMNYAKTTIDKLKAFVGMSPADLMPKIPGVKEPRTGMSMGQSCELMAQEWKLTQQEQDELAYISHQNAEKAYQEQFYSDLIVPFKGLNKDNNVRADTSVEKLSKLKPAFDRKSGKGTLTAGNSTPLTDGAACVFLCSEEYAKKNGFKIKAYLTHGQAAAVNFVNNEGLLMAPAYAVPRMLHRAGLTLQDFDFYEIHEAFAAQVLCTLKAWESEDFCRNKLKLDKALGSIDRKKMNVKGGSLALGHPFAATGARIVSSLAKILDQNNGGRGLISICTAGGMGVTAIMEK
ncbi:MAG: acetyl-CoA C-acetyltransferase [Bdellovibrio sp.]